MALTVKNRDGASNFKGSNVSLEETDLEIGVNGVGIADLKKSEVTTDGGVNRYRLILTDKREFQLNIRNGSKGTDADIAGAEEAKNAANQAAESANRIVSEAVASVQSINQDENQRKANENARIASEDARNQSETTRNSNEQLRISRENTRGTSENTRLQNERNRQNAESTRQSSETTRNNQEATRQSQETARQGNETTRQQNEEDRQTNETTRGNNETARISSETGRVNAETGRVNAENERVDSEDQREQNETTRQSNETTRQSNESVRQSNESQRQQTFETSQTQRQTAYTQAETNRNNLYTAEEDRRNQAFNDKEAVRDAANQAALDCADTLAQLGPKIGQIEDKIFKAKTGKFEKTINVAVGNRNFPIDVNIPTGSTIKYKYSSETAFASGITAVYGQYDGGYDVLKNIAALNTEYTFTALHDYTSFTTYISGSGATSAAVLEISYEYETENEDSLEAKIDDVGEEVKAIKDDADSTPIKDSDNFVKSGGVAKEMDTLKDGLFKTYDAVVYNKNVDVKVGDLSAAAHYSFNVDISTGDALKLIFGSESAIASSITAIYGRYDGGYDALRNNVQLNTEIAITALHDYTSMDFYIQGGATGAGVLNILLKSTVVTQNSLEERIENLEGDSGDEGGGGVDSSEWRYFDKKALTGSANKFDYNKLIRGKKINAYYGTISDDVAFGMSYLDVNPGDVIRFWRIHNNSPIEFYTRGYASFDENGTFDRSKSATEMSNNFVIAEGIHKIALNFQLEIIDADLLVIYVNDNSTPDNQNPEQFQPAGNFYFDTMQSLRYVDFNRLLPLTGKSPLAESIKSVGHAGGLQGYYPLNTELSIIGAKKAGFTCVEMDLQRTSDGVFVIYHDDNMVRVGGTSSQNIGNMTYEQLQEFDYGSWFSSRFAGTPLCTFERAVMLCKILNLEIMVDCKTVNNSTDLPDAFAIVKRWGMEDKTYWASNPGLCWAVDDKAKMMYALNSKLTGIENGWETEDGWFNNLPSMFEGKYEVVDGVPRFKDDVFVLVWNNYLKINDETYGLEGLQREAETARKYNIKYGLYAADDVDTIYTLVTSIPYLSFLQSNVIAAQNAVNQKLGIMMADYILPYSRSFNSNN